VQRARGLRDLGGAFTGLRDELAAERRRERQREQRRRAR